MNSIKKISLLVPFFCIIVASGQMDSRATLTPEEPSNIITQLLLAPLNFMQFCYSSYTFLKRDKSAKDLVESASEIRDYTIKVVCFTMDKRSALRSKTNYKATFNGIDFNKVIKSCETALKKLPQKTMIVTKPSITLDAGPCYALKTFTTPISNLEQLKKDLIDVFFVPESETLTLGKKIAIAIAPLSLAGVVALLVIL